MTQAPTAPATSRSYQPPYVRQFSVFLPNKVGRLMDLIDVFDGQQATLAGLNIQDSTDHAVVRLITSNSELTRRLLIREDFRFSMMDIVCVELNPEQTLLDVCRCLLEVELNLYYTYPLLVRPRKLPVIALYTDDIVFAGQTLRRKLFNLLCENELGLNATGNQPGKPTDVALGKPGPGDGDEPEPNVTTPNPSHSGGTSLDDIGDADPDADPDAFAELSFDEPGPDAPGPVAEIPPDDLTDYQPQFNPQTDGEDYPDLPGEDHFDLDDDFDNSLDDELDQDDFDGDLDDDDLNDGDLDNEDDDNPPDPPPGPPPGSRPDIREN